MFDVLTDGETRDGMWAIGTWDGEPCMWSIRDIKDVRANVYDYEPKMRADVYEAGILLKQNGSSWQSYYDSKIEITSKYEIWCGREIEIDGTNIHITRNSKLDKATHTLEQAKEFLLKEVEKIQLIKVGE